MTQFEAIIALMSAILGMLIILSTAVWKARGWVDRLNTTDGRLADAIEALTRTQTDQHAENRARFEQIERRLAAVAPLPPRRRRPGA